MPVARDASDQKLLEIVERHGWHVTLVEDDGRSPGFAYSTGIYARTRHPEVIVIGLPSDLGHFLVNEYGSACLRGTPPALWIPHEDYLEGNAVVFIEVTAPIGDKYATWTRWFYDGDDVPYVQLVFPDSETGAFPWEPGYREGMRHEQPMLGDMPSG